MVEASAADGDGHGTELVLGLLHSARYRSRVRYVNVAGNSPRPASQLCQLPGAINICHGDGVAARAQFQHRGPANAARSAGDEGCGR